MVMLGGRLAVKSAELGLVEEELEAVGGSGGRLKGVSACPPKPSGKAATPRASKWGEVRLKDWAV